MFSLHPSTILVSPGGGHHRLSDLFAGSAGSAAPGESLGSSDSNDREEVGTYDYDDSFIASEDGEPRGRVFSPAFDGSSAASSMSAALPSPKRKRVAARVATPWQTFCKASRASSKAALPAGAPNAEVMRHLAARWRAMSDEEQAAFRG